MNRPGKSLGVAYRVAEFAGPLLSKMGQAIQADDIAKAMARTVIAPASQTGFPDVFENEDIKKQARQYENEVASLSPTKKT